MAAGVEQEGAVPERITIFCLNYFMYLLWVDTASGGGRGEEARGGVGRHSFVIKHAGRKTAQDEDTQQQRREVQDAW